jgi:hypothetical protein
MEWDYTSAPELVRNLGGLVETWVQSTTALQARLVLAAQNHALDLVIEGKVAQSVLLPTLPGGEWVAGGPGTWGRAEGKDWAAVMRCRTAGMGMKKCRVFKVEP